MSPDTRPSAWSATEAPSWQINSSPQVFADLTPTSLSDISKVQTVRSKHNDTASLQGRIDVLIQGIQGQQADNVSSQNVGLRAQPTSGDYDSLDVTGDRIDSFDIKGDDDLVEGSVSGSTSAPIYSFGTTPSVHDVSSLAHVTSGSGIADNDADERTSNGGAFKTTSPESVAQQPLQMRTGPGVLGHSCGANARAHQGRVADASPHGMESENTAGNLSRAEVPLEAKPSSDDVRVEASPKHDDSHVPRVELSDEAAKAIKDEMEALQLD